MINLKNNEEIINTYNNIYEKLYSFDKLHLKKRKKTILKNLREIKFKNFKNSEVMDVGSGIQGYIFYLLKFKKIFHYDLNPAPVKNINSLNIKNFKSKINDFNKDIIKKKFNLIYLYGVVHHIKKYNFFLNNIIKNLKTDGKIFLRIYRSGSFSFFIVDFLRKIIANKKDFLKFVLMNHKKSEPDDIVSDLIDDIYVPNLKLFDVKNLIYNFKKNGFNLFFNSKFKEYDHNSHVSTQGISLCFKKNKNVSHDFNVKNMDQIKDIHYKEKYILDNINLIRLIIKNKKKISNKNLYKFAVEIYTASHYLNKKQKITSRQNHKKINEIIKRFIRSYL